MVNSIYKNIFDFSKTKPFTLWVLNLFASFLIMISFIMGGSVLLIGSAISILFVTAILMICYNAIKGKAYHVENLFDYFKDFNLALHIIGGTLYANLFVLLWSLIPIVGPFIGIVKAYEYRLVPFILANEPEIPATDARTVSSMRTEGYKGKMFLADILWVVIVLVALVILFCLSRLPFVGWIFNFLFILGLILFYALAPVISNLIRAEFYVRIPDIFCTGKAIEFGEDSKDADSIFYSENAEPDIEVELVDMQPEYDNISQEVLADAIIADLVDPSEESASKKPAARKTAAKKTAAKKPASKSTAKKPVRKKTQNTAEDLF